MYTHAHRHIAASRVAGVPMCTMGPGSPRRKGVNQRTLMDTYSLSTLSPDTAARGVTQSHSVSLCGGLRPRAVYILLRVLTQGGVHRHTPRTATRSTSRHLSCPSASLDELSSVLSASVTPALAKTPANRELWEQQQGEQARGQNTNSHLYTRSVLPV